MGALKLPLPTERLPFGAIFGASGLSASLGSSTWGSFSYFTSISFKRLFGDMAIRRRHRRHRDRRQSALGY